MANGDLKETFGSQYAGANEHAGATSETIATKALATAGSNRQYAFLFNGFATEDEKSIAAHRVQELWMVTVQDVGGTYEVDAELIHSGNGSKAVTFSFTLNGNTLEAKCAAAATDASGGQFLGFSLEKSVVVSGGGGA